MHVCVCGVDLPVDLGQICQIQLLVVSTRVVHLLADLGQICKIQPIGVSTGGNICWQIQGRSAKFSCQLSVLGGTSAGRSRVDLPNLAARCQYWVVHLLADLGQICKIQQLGISTGGKHLQADLMQICQIWALDVSSRGYICQQMQGSSSKIGHQIPVLGGTSASRSRVDLPNLAIRYQYWGVHLLADLGQICQIWPLDVSTGGKSAWGETSAGRSRVDLPNLATRMCQLADLRQICQIQALDWQQGGTSAGRSRVDLPNLATRYQYQGVHLPADLGQICQIQHASCQYWWVHLPADLGQICQIWPPDISTRGYICQQIQGRSAKFGHQMSVLGGYICWQIQGRSVKFDLPICSPTSILYVKLGKYDLSELKSFIFI